MAGSKLLQISVACLAAATANAAPHEVRATAGKRGLPYNTASLANMFTPYPEITWGYNWYYASKGLSTQYEYVPMLYNDPTGDASYIANWKSNATAAIKAGSTHLLAFNEPDLAKVAPAVAAAAYQKYMNPLGSSTVKLGAPAVTNGGAPYGITWLNQFLGNCTSCTIDFIPFHWYCGYNNIKYFTQYVQQMYTAGGNRPLWITEFQGDNVQCNSPATDDQQDAFMKTVIPWLDSLSYVERYAYFGTFKSSSTQTYLLNQNGTGFSNSGQTYATISGANSTTPTTLVASN